MQNILRQQWIVFIGAGLVDVPILKPKLQKSITFMIYRANLIDIIVLRSGFLKQDIAENVCPKVGKRSKCAQT